MNQWRIVVPLVNAAWYNDAVSLVHASDSVRAVPSSAASIVPSAFQPSNRVIELKLCLKLLF
ncbi:hypothetical protein NECAME_04782 [Necator americanus]|uniref:Uncharacterized protein n=1 Tax=Necator americanus TaxID=51031 RepID=W2SPY5_NECAM|nr:hypothetical protein NECAME_04782 [Necator americanus]ETN70931.1 hypothetical protein NECAME_04782 [Necator americanus]